MTTPPTPDAVREQSNVLSEFELFVCDEGKGACDHFDCQAERKMAAEIIRLRAQLAAAKADGARFALVAIELLNNGMVVGGIDVSEEACHEAVAHGREEPTDDDRVMAARIAVDALRLELESPPADAARTGAR